MPNIWNIAFISHRIRCLCSNIRWIIDIAVYFYPRLSSTIMPRSSTRNKHADDIQFHCFFVFGMNQLVSLLPQCLEGRETWMKDS